MHVPLAHGNAAVPHSPHDRESVRAGLAQSSAEGMPNRVYHGTRGVSGLSVRGCVLIFESVDRKWSEAPSRPKTHKVNSSLPLGFAAWHGVIPDQRLEVLL